MRDAMVGSVVGAMIISALSYAAVAQSASERYPAARTSLLIWRDLAGADRHAASRDTDLHQAWRDGWRAGWHAAHGSR